MPRIRSIHPGYFQSAHTKLSDAVQLLLLGLATLADDFGVFVWDTHAIKVQLRPGTAESAADIEWNLMLLEQAGALKTFIHDGVQYGALRNFAVHQRPQAPKAVYPCPDNLHEFIGFTPESYRERVNRGQARAQYRTRTGPVSYPYDNRPSYNQEGNQDKNISYQEIKRYKDRAMREDLTWASAQIKEIA